MRDHEAWLSRVLRPAECCGGRHRVRRFGPTAEVLFEGAQISNSGDSRSDLFIVEVGSSDVAFDVALRPAPPTTAEHCLAPGPQVKALCCDCVA